MSCNRKTSGGNSATLDGNSGNSDATFEGRNSGNSAVTFEGDSENSPIISAKYLGLVKTSNIIYILILRHRADDNNQLFVYLFQIIQP